MDFYLEFFEYLKNNINNDDNMTSFPIGKIDNLPCIIFTKINKENNLVLFIRLPHKCRILYSVVLFNVLSLKKFIDDLKNMKFNNIIGRFELDIKYPIKTSDIFKCDNIETTINECSVCYENTQNNTICNHPLCLRCETHLIKNNKHKCPICRKCLINCPLLNSEESEESDLELDSESEEIENDAVNDAS